MSVTSGFFNSIDDDRLYDANQMSSIFDGIINDGVFGNIGTVFAVTEVGDTTVSVGAGRAWFNSAWLLNDAPLALSLDLSEVLLNRIDAIVIEINHTVQVRSGSIKIIKGTPSSSAQRPVMVNTQYVHQYPLAFIERRAASTVITQSDITNMVGTSECPYVTAILEVTNIDHLVAQWQSQWNDWTTAEKAEFDAWIASLQGIIGDDALANLSAQIYRMNHVLLVELKANAWVGTVAPFSQVVTMEDMTPNMEAMVVSNLQTGATLAIQKAYNKAYGIITSGTAEIGDGEITFYVYKKPATDIVIGLRNLYAF